MKHIGETLKYLIETNGLPKGEVAKSANITYNYLSDIFHKSTINCGLLDRLCKAIGVNAGYFFEEECDIDTVSPEMGNIELHKLLKEKDELIKEKERTIQILLKVNPVLSGTSTEQNPSK